MKSFTLICSAGLLEKQKSIIWLEDCIIQEVTFKISTKYYNIVFQKMMINFRLLLTLKDG